MAIPSSVTTIARMTEPWSLLAPRLIHKAKELPHPPHRVTLSSGEKGERGKFSVLLCHPVAFKPNSNLSSCRGEVGYILLEGDGLIFLSSGGGVYNSHSSYFRIWP